MTEAMGFGAIADFHDNFTLLSVISLAKVQESLFKLSMVCLGTARHSIFLFLIVHTLPFF